jgi:hypothetical protein
MSGAEPVRLVRQENEIGSEVPKLAPIDLRVSFPVPKQVVRAR